MFKQYGLDQGREVRHSESDGYFMGLVGREQGRPSRKRGVCNQRSNFRHCLNALVCGLQACRKPSRNWPTFQKDSSLSSSGRFIRTDIPTVIPNAAHACSRAGGME